MFFNSLEFAVFLPVVFFGYWFVFFRNLKVQNLFLVVVSYFFYGWWDWRFLSLILFSSCVDYVVGVQLNKTKPTIRRKLLLIISIIVNIGFLGFFKYYNFFVESFVQAFSFFGTPPNVDTLKIILPVGISFYTFQTLSYSIDVYRQRISPTKDIIAFLAFVSFFPQLVAGPIERAGNLLPQFLTNRKFEYNAAADGARQIVLGLFKKMVIADNCAVIVDRAFDNCESYSGSSLALGMFFFSFQIYCDFSGYSDIAIGSAKLLGFKLQRNFAYPYFARDIAEFWRRWHISLTTWFRDYVYIPLGGSRGSLPAKIRNILVVFLVSGLWHGAAWTFVSWGFLHTLFFIPLMLLGMNRKHLGSIRQGHLLPGLREFVQMLLTFSIVTIAWVFFRAQSISHAFTFLNTVFSSTLFSSANDVTQLSEIIVILPILFLVIAEWLQRERQHAFEFNTLRPLYRRLTYSAVLITTMTIGKFGQNEFIYFQF